MDARLQQASKQASKQASILFKLIISNLKFSPFKFFIEKGGENFPIFSKFVKQ